MYRNMTDDDLRDAYWALRTALANSGNLACSTTTRRGRQAAARGVGRNLRDLDLVVAIARKRGISLTRAS